MPLFSKVFKSKDTNKKIASTNINGIADSKPQWVDSWLRTRVDPQEVSELIHGCTQELKSRALDIPLLLLPFRPASDPSAARTFVRNYFIPPNDRPKLKGGALMNELRMTEVMVLISVMKWCWARLPGGVVSWDTYKMFVVGERDSKYARNAYTTFIPISVESNHRLSIINDFFDLLAALAAHGKSNGLSGHKLSRYAGWWAFEHYDAGKGFEAGYRAWNKAADAACHLFFAYLRSMAPEPGKTNGILDLPRSLQQLVAATDYPPISNLLSNDTTKVVMVVDVVSPTPYALLRRAKNFEYRDDDEALQRFADYDDPVDALTDECRRVLRAISSTNQSNVSDAKTSTSLVDPSWSRFEDIGFSSALDDIGEVEKVGLPAFSPIPTQSMSINGRSHVMDLNRPTTPSWADFLSSGFTDENGNRAPSTVLLPPDKMLPPIITEARGQSSQSHRRNIETASMLEPGELASITKVNIDDTFWWVWITSLAGEEPTSRKACFGRCALVETLIHGGRWMILEEQIKGAAPEPTQGAYIAEKKSFLGFSKRGRLTRRRSGIKKSPMASNSALNPTFNTTPSSTLAADQQAKIRRAAQELANKKRAEEAAMNGHNRRGRFDDPDSRNNSIFTLGPHIKAEASPALQWAKQYDKKTVRAQYLGSALAGKGSTDFLNLPPPNGLHATRSTSTLSETLRGKDLPTVPKEESDHVEPMPEPTATETVPSHNPAPQPAPRDTPVVPLEPESGTATVPVESATLRAPAAAPVLVEPPHHAISTEVPSSTSESEKLQALPESKDIPVPPQPTAIAGSVQPTPSPAASRESSREDSTLAQRPNSIRRLFGTLRKNREEHVAPRPAPAPNPSVAAARRALESKLNPTPSAPLPSHLQSAKPNSTKAAVVATGVATTAVIATLPPRRREAESSPVVPANIQASESDSTRASAHAAEPSGEPVAENVGEPGEAVHALPVAVTKTLEPSPVFDESAIQPPKTRRDEEFDNLSRVDTKEREHADREFSRFDQGPLLDQPAVVPGHVPQDHLHEEGGHRIKHQSIYESVTMDPESTDEESEVHKDAEEQSEPHQEMSANDRWAQIRKNAAERAGRFSEENGNRSRTETRTDDGDTSGEETIESRVARIKARVAELTGNMEGIRR